MNTKETIDEIAVVSDIDDKIETDSLTFSNTLRRSNVGARVERIQMEFSGKWYRAKWEFNFTTNIRRTDNAQTDMSSDTLMKGACDVVSTQMSSKDDQKKYAQMTPNDAIKKIGQAVVSAIVK